MLGHGGVGTRTPGGISFPCGRRRLCQALFLREAPQVGQVVLGARKDRGFVARQWRKHPGINGIACGVHVRHTGRGRAVYGGAIVQHGGPLVAECGARKGCRWRRHAGFLWALLENSAEKMLQGLGTKLLQGQSPQQVQQAAFTKWAPGKDPFDEEAALQALVPTDRWQAAKLADVVNEEKQRILNMLRLVGSKSGASGAATEQSYAAIQALKTQLMAINMWAHDMMIQSTSAEIKRDWVRDFIGFLRGKVTSWENVQIGKLCPGWDIRKDPPVHFAPDVRAYLTQFLDRHVGFMGKLLAMQGPSRPTTLPEYYVFYKYLVKGEAISPEGSDFFYDMFNLPFTPNAPMDLAEMGPDRSKMRAPIGVDPEVFEGGPEDEQAVPPPPPRPAGRTYGEPDFVATQPLPATSPSQDAETLAATALQDPVGSVDFIDMLHTATFRNPKEPQSDVLPPDQFALLVDRLSPMPESGVPDQKRLVMYDFFYAAQLQSAEPVDPVSVVPPIMTIPVKVWDNQGVASTGSAFVDPTYASLTAKHYSVDNLQNPDAFWRPNTDQNNWLAHATKWLNNRQILFGDVAEYQPAAAGSMTTVKPEAAAALKWIMQQIRAQFTNTEGVDPFSTQAMGLGPNPTGEDVFRFFQRVPGIGDQSQWYGMGPDFWPAIFTAHYLAESGANSPPPPRLLENMWAENIVPTWGAMARPWKGKNDDIYRETSGFDGDNPAARAIEPLVSLFANAPDNVIRTYMKTLQAVAFQRPPLWTNAASLSPTDPSQVITARHAYEVLATILYSRTPDPFPIPTQTNDTEYMGEYGLQIWKDMWTKTRPLWSLSGVAGDLDLPEQPNPDSFRVATGGSGKALLRALQNVMIPRLKAHDTPRHEYDNVFIQHGPQSWSTAQWLEHGTAPPQFDNAPPAGEGRYGFSMRAWNKTAPNKYEPGDANSDQLTGAKDAWSVAWQTLILLAELNTGTNVDPTEVSTTSASTIDGFNKGVESAGAGPINWDLREELSTLQKNLGKGFSAIITSNNEATLQQLTAAMAAVYASLDPKTGYADLLKIQPLIYEVLGSKLASGDDVLEFEAFESVWRTTLNQFRNSYAPNAVTKPARPIGTMPVQGPPSPVPDIGGTTARDALTNATFELQERIPQDPYMDRQSGYQRGDWVELPLAPMSARQLVNPGIAGLLEQRNVQAWRTVQAMFPTWQDQLNAMGKYMRPTWQSNGPLYWPRMRNIIMRLMKVSNQMNTYHKAADRQLYQKTISDLWTKGPGRPGLLDAVYWPSLLNNSLTGQITDDPMKFMVDWTVSADEWLDFFSDGGGDHPKLPQSQAHAGNFQAFAQSLNDPMITVGALQAGLDLLFFNMYNAWNATVTQVENMPWTLMMAPQVSEREYIFKHTGWLPPPDFGQGGAGGGGPSADPVKPAAKKTAAKKAAAKKAAASTSPIAPPTPSSSPPPIAPPTPEATPPSTPKAARRSKAPPLSPTGPLPSQTPKGPPSSSTSSQSQPLSPPPDPTSSSTEGPPLPDATSTSSEGPPQTPAPTGTRATPETPDSPLTPGGPPSFHDTLAYLEQSVAPQVREGFETMMEYQKQHPDKFPKTQVDNMRGNWVHMLGLYANVKPTSSARYVTEQFQKAEKYLPEMIATFKVFTNDIVGNDDPAAELVLRGARRTLTRLLAKSRVAIHRQSPQEIRPPLRPIKDDIMKNTALLLSKLRKAKT